MNGRIGRAILAVGPPEFDHGRFLSEINIEHFNGEAKNHGKIDIALIDVLSEAFGQEHNADENQKTEREHFDRRMFFNESADRIDKGQHDQHGQDDGEHHDGQMIGHAHGGDDGVERKNDVEQYDLNHHGLEAGGDGGGFFPVSTFQFFVNFFDGFPNQEKPAGGEDQLFSGRGQRKPEGLEVMKGLVESHHPF